MSSPPCTSIGDGGWDTPRTPLPALLGAQLPLDPPAGDYRVLYLGDPRVLPVPGHEYRDGIALAVVDDGPLEFTDRWAPPTTDADQVVVDALDRIADGSTLRAGALFAPTGIRFIVLPEIDGAQSTVDDPLPVPSGLIEALSEQLDISTTYGPPTIRVFEVAPWLPVIAQLTGSAAEASRLAGDDVLVRADLSEHTPLFIGRDPSDGATADVGAGVVHIAVPFENRIQLRVGDDVVDPRPGFGSTTAFDIAQPTTATLRYREPTSRMLWLLLQAALWLAVFAIASRARSPFGRRRGELLTDETLIDLDELPPPAVSSRIAGEVLGGGLAWAPDLDPDEGLPDLAPPVERVDVPHDAVADASGPTVATDRSPVTSSCRSMSTSGMISEISSSRGPRMLKPLAAVKPTRSMPDRPVAIRRAVMGARVARAISRRASSRNASPAGVSWTFRLSRSRSSVPMVFSSFWICRLRGGCVILSRSAALPKCSSSATAMNPASWSNVNMMPSGYHSMLTWA